MAQDIKIMDMTIEDVPAVNFDKVSGGVAKYTDVTDTTAVASDVAQGKYFYDANGVRKAGTSSGGGGGGQNILCGTSAPAASIGNDGDIYIQLQSGGTVEAYPADFTAQNMNSTSHLSDCIGVSAEDGTSTSNTYSSGSSVTGTADYTFDLSSIPSNAIIKSVTLQVKAHEENASRSKCTIRAYAGTTAKGSLTTVNGTSNAIYDVSVGSWTREELDNFVMRLSLGYYGGLIAGATLTVEYEAEAQWSVNLKGDADGWSISGDGIYKKTNGSWALVSETALEDSITRS